MKIAVTSTGPTLDDMVNERFGRSAYFLIVDPGTLDFEPMENPNISLGGGAGPQSAQLMADKGVSVVLTGSCGPNAFRTFGAAGIQVITGASGRVRQAVEEFNTGKLGSAASTGVQGPSGMGTGHQPPVLSRKEEMERLRSQADELKRKISDIESSIESLEKG
jgi:predicted Fe-Mo cluster-binding NifX family protein